MQLIERILGHPLNNTSRSYLCLSVINIYSSVCKNCTDSSLFFEI